jgi:hypothetical protein
MGVTVTHRPAVQKAGETSRASRGYAGGVTGGNVVRPRADALRALNVDPRRVPALTGGCWERANLWNPHTPRNRQASPGANPSTISPT